MLTSEAARRLVPLLRILDWGPSEYGVVGDDVVLDAWFGPRSPLLTADRSWPGRCRIALSEVSRTGLCGQREAFQVVGDKLGDALGSFDPAADDERTEVAGDSAVSAPPC
jgi:hypothetical protein